MTYEEIVGELEQEIQGGSAMFNLFLWIEENLSVEEETTCAAFDDNFFVCTDCDWNLPICCMSESRDHVCTDCSNDYDEDLD